MAKKMNLVISRKSKISAGSPSTNRISNGMNPVVHFEMPAKDKKRVTDFYTKAFGWKMVQTGPEMGNYIVAQTTETDQNNMVQTPGNINGGFFDYKIHYKGYRSCAEHDICIGAY